MLIFYSCAVSERGKFGALHTVGEIKKTVKILDTGFEIRVYFVPVNVFHRSYTSHSDGHSLGNQRFNLGHRK
jgi:hypothetical protein